MQPKLHYICGWLHFQLSHFCKDKNAVPLWLGGQENPEPCQSQQRGYEVPTFGQCLKYICPVLKLTAVSNELDSCILFVTVQVKMNSEGLFTDSHILATPFGHYMSYICAGFVRIKL